MVEVDMGCEDMCHFLWIEASFLDRPKQRIHHAAWPGVNYGKLIVSRQQVGADDLIFAEKRM
jgi:hypothetical protein